jgi:hypothetical protein
MTYENDEMLDEYYATVCPSCQENAVDAYEEKCTHCLLEEMSVHYNDRKYLWPTCWKGFLVPWCH